MFAQHSQMAKDCRFCSRRKAFILITMEQPVSRAGELLKRTLMGIVIHYNPVMLPLL